MICFSVEQMIFDREITMKLTLVATWLHELPKAARLHRPVLLKAAFSKQP